MPIKSDCWPYLTLAWRLLGDERASSPGDSRFVRIVDFGDDGGMLASLANMLRGLHHARAQPLDQSVRGGTQTDGSLLSRIDPQIQILRGKFHTEVCKYLTELPAKGPGVPPFGTLPKRPRFSGSWSVRLSDGGFHEPHIHGDGMISSAFYVSIPPMNADSDVGWLTLGEPPAALALGLGPTQIVEPKPGRLVLFPSTMWHGTRPFPSGERLTVAFDII